MFILEVCSALDRQATLNRRWKNSKPLEQTGFFHIRSSETMTSSFFQFHLFPRPKTEFWQNMVITIAQNFPRASENAIARPEAATP